MLLSTHQIKQAIEAKRITIEPFDENNFKEASYTFHLSNKIFVYSDNQIVDPMHKEFTRDEITISSDGYLLQPNQFIVGMLEESLELDHTIAGLLSVRGSCAQLGLNTLNSDLFVEPGCSCNLKLAIKNINTTPIKLHAGMPIVKGIFFKVS